jgi:N-acetylglucosaminyl-diphospho-decaprenol L-rhamnosyltransferase
MRLKLNMPKQAKISISIVSHNQGALIAELLSDLGTYCTLPFEVILTINVPEVLPFEVKTFDFPVRIVTNTIPKGFGANHNAAFRLGPADFFCVLNPDIRLKNDPFPPLLDALSDPANGVVGPLVIGLGGNIEDSARRFPTPSRILKKAIFGVRGTDYEIGQVPLYPDWIGGMFMVFRSKVFQEVGGFDDRYFLYYEDVDLCWRLRRHGYQAILTPLAHAVHDARQTSHRNMRYLFWHLNSMLRFFMRRRDPQF